MCGLAGFTADIAIEDKPGLLKKMIETMRHRGPDEKGYYQDDKFFLGVCRLSIIDITGGSQPMQNEDGTIQLVYNGEIYNFKELRQELLNKGHIFKTDSDTEVIVHAYEEYGQGCLAKLKGMFAFALWDKRKEELFLARDRLGIKPLYYTYLSDGNLIFASEIKAILQAQVVRREVDLAALDQYLTFLWVPDPKTILKGIYKLPAGHYLIYKNKTIEIKEYWDLRFIESSLDEKEWVEKILSKFEEVMQKHLISDVPLGIFLSGGLDSTTILAFTNKMAKRKMTTYTTAFRKEDLSSIHSDDDLQYAKLAARAFNAEHIAITLRPDMVNLLPKVVYHLDEPIADTAALTTYLISQAAGDRFKVLLSGMGGDEIFAGYPWDLGARLMKFYKYIPASMNDMIAACINLVPNNSRHSFLRRFKKMAYAANNKDILGFRTYFNKFQKGSLYTRQTQWLLKDSNPYDKHLMYLNRVKDKDLLAQMLYLDIKTFLPCLNLAYTDKMSMANSIEVRVPFLDHELVELAAAIPSRLKIKGFQQKYIYRKAMKSLLPKEIIKRKKIGFGAPVSAWFTDLKVLIEELLSPDAVKKRGYFDYNFISRLKKDSIQNWMSIWQLLILELWHRAFIDE